MTEFKKFVYKGITVVVSVSDMGKFYAKALSLITSCPTDGNRGWSTLEECKTQMKEMIDSFLSQRITTYQELATAITSNLTWTGYEDCYMDETILKILIEQFHPE